jgi:hypothetical protein
MAAMLSTNAQWDLPRPREQIGVVDWSCDGRSKCGRNHGAHASAHHQDIFQDQTSIFSDLPE